MNEENLCLSLNRRYNALKRILALAGLKSRKIFAYSLFMSKLSYLISVWGGHSEQSGKNYDKELGAFNSRPAGPAGVAISESIILLPNSSTDVQTQAQQICRRATSPTLHAGDVRLEL